MRYRRYTAHDEQLSRLIAQTRHLCRSSAQLLSQPRPDTFLGRKTQEPFAYEEVREDSLVKVVERPPRGTRRQ